MIFDWVAFFQTHNIHHVLTGPNTSKGQVGIRCPWCGQADESEHLSVNLEGKGFRCWRQPLHSGKNPAKLIQALLNCSWEQATLLAGQTKSLPNDFMQKVRSSLANKQQEAQVKSKLKLPAEFKQFSKLPSCKMYAEYMRKRLYNDHTIMEGTKAYGMYYATQGNYKGRILFTVHYKEQLTGWTGRTIYLNEQVRYKTLTSDMEKAKERNEQPAPNPISHYLLFYDMLEQTLADTIVLCEGPFDALRVNILGAPIGVIATCFFTSTMSEQQTNLLHELLPKFKNKFLLLDQNTFSKAVRIRSDLASLCVKIKHLPDGVKDPGEIKTTRDLKTMLAIV